MEKKVKTEGKSLLDTYLTYHHLTLRSTTSQEPTRDGMPFMPMLLMDAMNLLYEEYIAPLPLKHREKQLRTRWHDAYKHYISQEFMAFDDDQKCEICELMNEFEETIHNEVEMFRVVVMNHFMNYDTEVRLTLSAILSCNILAQSAEYIWNALRGRNNASPFIVSVVNWSHEMLNVYGDKVLDRTQKKIDLNKFNDIRVSISKLCNAIAIYSKSLEV